MASSSTGPVATRTRSKVKEEIGAPAAKRIKTDRKVWKVYYRQRVQGFTVYGDNVEAFKSEVRTAFGLSDTSALNFQDEDGNIMVLSPDIPTDTSMFLPVTERKNPKDAFLLNDMKYSSSGGVHYTGESTITVFEDLGSCCFRGSQLLSLAGGRRHFELVVAPFTCCCYVGLVPADFPPDLIGGHGGLLAKVYSDLALTSSSNHPKKVIFDFFFDGAAGHCLIYYRLNEWGAPCKIAWFVKNITSDCRIAVSQVKHPCKFTLTAQNSEWPPVPLKDPLFLARRVKQHLKDSDESRASVKDRQ